jgi:dTDP-4-dehydrorhamnose reductase
VRAATARHIILRTSWIYGEFGNNFLKTVLRLAQDRDELRIVSDQRGCPTSTRDIAEAIFRIAPMLAGEPSLYGTYHFAGAGATSWHGFATRIVEAQAQVTGRRPRVTAITTAQVASVHLMPARGIIQLDGAIVIKPEAAINLRGERREMPSES